MHIILDANVYASDYRMEGVSFRTLFEYLRRTQSSLVLPRLIREEIVLGYGRRLKSEAKEFAEVHNRYRYLDLSGHWPVFEKPNLKDAMNTLRRKLMKPAGDIVPIYVAEMEGISISEVFMRGILRIKPANSDGEELRDVIIWLWVLQYSTSKNGVAFISDDSTFWTKEGVHPDIERDLQHANGKVTIHRSIDDFIKQHAPAPTEVTAEWLHNHFDMRNVERDLIYRAGTELTRFVNGLVRDLTLESSVFEGGASFKLRQTHNLLSCGFS